MLESVPVIIVIGTTLGFLSGIGIGGGSLLIVWLTIVLHMDPVQARGINLLFFLPSALIACFFRWKQGCLKVRQVLPAVIAGCISAAVCSWFSLTLNTAVLKKAFGGLLIITGIREVMYRKNQV